MLSPADQAFIASVDIPSLRLALEEAALPRCELADAMRDTLGDPPHGCHATRVIVGHEIAAAAALSALVRLVRALESDRAQTLSVLAKADAAAPGAPASLDGASR